MERQYIFWVSGKGCLAALVLYTVALIVLPILFLLIPGYHWLHLLLSLAVFATVTHVVFAVDEKSKRNKL